MGIYAMSGNRTEIFCSACKGVGEDAEGNPCVACDGMGENPESCEKTISTLRTRVAELEKAPIVAYRHRLVFPREGANEWDITTGKQHPYGVRGQDFDESATVETEGLVVAAMRGTKDQYERLPEYEP